MFDQTKLILFLAFSVAVLILLMGGHSRPLASAPLDGNDRPGESQTPADTAEDIQPTWAVNVPTMYPMPLALMTPDAGAAPVVN